MKKDDSEREAEQLDAKLQRLHFEFIQAQCTIAAEHERKADEALRVCTAEMAKIQSDADSQIREACEAYRKVENASPDQASTHYAEYEKKVREITASARERAEAARTVYREAWKHTNETTQDVRHKAHVDYLTQVQETWRQVNLETLDPAGIEEVTRTLHCGSGRGITL